MINNFFGNLEALNLQIWVFFGFPLIIFLGILLSIKSRFVQLRKFPQTLRLFWGYVTGGVDTTSGVHPMKAFFASVGGAVGIGNIIAVCAAIQVGGPGALFWIWVVAIFGMILKYSEVYLGVKYRKKNQEGQYVGGPMYFLKFAYKKNSWIGSLVAVLLCIYGVEIYQFQVVSETMSINFGIHYLIFTLFFLALVIYSGSGGIRRVGNICSFLMPLFMSIFLIMGCWVVFMNISEVPNVIALIFKSAFSGAAPLGGFVGSSIFLTVSQGMKSGCYASDVGVGYAAVIHSESSVQEPEKQASLIFIDFFLDIVFVCTMSVMIILSTGLWSSPLPATLLIQTALSQYFPYMGIFMPLFIFILGYSTVISYFSVGLRCSEYLCPNKGKFRFIVFSILFFLIFSFFESRHALTVMSLVQLTLLGINLTGTYLLRGEISFDLDADYEASPVPVLS